MGFSYIGFDAINDTSTNMIMIGKKNIQNTLYLMPIRYIFKYITKNIKKSSISLNTVRIIFRDLSGVGSHFKRTRTKMGTETQEIEPVKRRKTIS